MSKYSIESYQESFLEAQEKVGIEATKNRRAFGQTPAAMLKEIYSRPGFDPETKLYAFEGEKLVGFLTSEITQEDPKKANLEFPIVLQGHEECSELLFNKALENLKKKGVSKIQTRVSDIWFGTKELAEKWGYKYLQDLYMLLEADLDNLSLTSTTTFNIVDYDHSRDSEQMVQIWVDKFKQEKKYAESNFKRIAEDKEIFPVHIVIREADQIKGRAMASKNPNDPQEYNLGTFVYEKDEELDALLAEVVSRLKDIGAEKISLFLYGDTLPLEEKYVSYGFEKAAQIDYYEREI